MGRPRQQPVAPRASRGWTPETIVEGDRIKVHGHLGRDGRKLMSWIYIELADGTRLGSDY